MLVDSKIGSIMIKENNIILELDEQEFLYLARKAHEKDITLNKLIEEIIIRYMNEKAQ